MKTVALNNRTAVRSFFALAALAGLYYYSRKGGTVSGLIARGTDALGTARGMINRVAPSVSEIADGQIAAPKKRDRSVSASAQI